MGKPRHGGIMTRAGGAQWDKDQVHLMGGGASQGMDVGGGGRTGGLQEPPPAPALPRLHILPPQCPIPAGLCFLPAPPSTAPHLSPESAPSTHLSCPGAGGLEAPRVLRM